MKILIADDESLIRMGLKSMLRELGHDVLTAKNGRDALQQAREHTPDLAILDIRMPLTNGLDAARAMVKTRPIPIIMLTAFGDADLVEQASELPIQGYMIKPVRSAELSATITVATKRFQDQQAEIAKREKAEQRLEDRILVDRAKSKLMKGGMSEEDAFKRIQQIARDKRVTLGAVAQAILGIEGL